MPNHVTEIPTLRRGMYTAWLAKFLEDKAKAKESSPYEGAICQAESPLSTQMEREGALPGKDEQPGSRHGSKALHKPDREAGLVDSSPYRLYQPAKCAKNRSVNTFNTI